MKTNALLYMRQGQHWFNDALDFIVHHGRNSEWATVMIKVYMAYALALPGETLNLKTYENVRAIGLSDSKMVMVLTILAVVHAAALAYNGSVKRTPVWRGGCCFAGLIIFGMMGYLTWSSSMTTPGMLPGLFIGLAFLSLTGCRRAGDDYRCLTQRP